MRPLSLPLRSAAVLGLGLLLPALAPASALGRAPGAEAPRYVQDRDGVEGPLRNDAFQPLNEAARTSLRRGDEAWARSTAGGPGATSDRAAAFDAWREALELGEPGDAVPGRDPSLEPADLWADPDGTLARRSEGLNTAVERRLAELAPEDLRRWTERFEPLAREALDLAGADREALARVARTHPHTRAAARADLRLADLCSERGRPLAARTHLRRARTHLRDGGGRPLPEAWRRALDAREAALGPGAAAVTAAAGPAAGSALDRARDLDVHRADLLEGLVDAGRPGLVAPLGRGLGPGLAQLSDGSVAVQSARALVWLPPATLEQALGGDVHRLDLTEALSLAGLSTYAAPSTGGWNLRPVADGARVVLVAGRGSPGRMVRGLPLPAEGNVLACFQRPGSGPPELCWELSSRHLRVGAERRDPALTLGEGVWEFQPGPVVVDDGLVVLARRMPDPEGPGAARGGELWLVCLGLADGAPRWRRYVTRASDLRADAGGRLGSLTDLTTSGMPLALHDGRVAVCTNTGLVATFDAADGRLGWTFRYRRRRAEDPGWPGSRAPQVDAEGLWVAPFDSDFAYGLRWTPGPEGLLRATPLPLGQDLDLVHVDEQGALLLGQDGPHRALRWRGSDGSAGSVLYLGAEERFGGSALASPGRLVLSTDRRVYLFDRREGLGLLSARPLPDAGGGRGGDVRWAGGRLFVVGQDTLWTLLPR